MAISTATQVPNASAVVTAALGSATVLLVVLGTGGGDARGRRRDGGGGGGGDDDGGGGGDRTGASDDGHDGPDDQRIGPVDSAVGWVLLFGNRRWIAALISALVFGSLLVVGTVWEFEMETLVTETRAVQTLFNTLLGGVILFVSVVLSINVAALSQEFRPLQVKQTQIEDSIDFQIELEELAGTGVSPPGLGAFLTFVLRAVRTETVTLRTRAEAIDDASSRERLRSFVGRVEASLSRVEGRLDGDGGRVSRVLLAGLDFDYAEHINTARRIRAVDASVLDESARASLDRVIDILTVFAAGREYYATLYFKRELRNLSRDLLVLSLPVIVFTAYVLLAIDAGLFPSVTLPGVEPRLLYVTFAFVVALSPYVLLSSYMLRIVTVSKHSLESTGFSTDREALNREAD